MTCFTNLVEIRMLLFRPKTSFVLMLITAISFSGAASADILGTTGSAVAVSPPSSVVPNVLESDTEVFAFYESTKILTNDLDVDGSAPGTYNSSVISTLAAGQLVNSYYLHSDKVGSSATGVPFSGSVTLDVDERIIGVLTVPNRMNFSNYLGAAGTSYSNVQNRGFELSPSEYFTISADRRTLSFQNSNSTVADQLRILTTTVPEPSALMMAAVAGIVLAMKRRRS
jgi:hypothetical protein